MDKAGIACLVVAWLLVRVLDILPEFKRLHEDPRWEQLLDRLGEEFNFDFNASH